MMIAAMTVIHDLFILLQIRIINIKYLQIWNIRVNENKVPGIQIFNSNRKDSQD